MERTKIFFSTWNVEGKGNPAEVSKLLSQHSILVKSDRRNPHIVCVQQANLPSDDEVFENYKWLCSGKFGSAVLVSKASSLKPISFEQVCEQICVAEVEADDGPTMKIISCYITPPTEFGTKDLWSKLVEVIKNIPCNMAFVLAGDFNAEIGKEDVPLSGNRSVGAIGPKLFHQSSNENGLLLKKLVIDSQALITSTFGGDMTDTNVYTHKNEEEMSQRSYIIVPYERIGFPSRLLNAECRCSWYQGYQSAVLTKSLRFMNFENFTSLQSSEVIVSCWNVQGASPSVVDKALSGIHTPVVCVQDVFLTSDDNLESKNYTWFTSKKPWGKNIGILVKNSPEIVMDKFEVISEYLCVGNINFKGCAVKVISCCLPPHSDNERFQEATVKLMEVVKNIPEETLYVVAGDFSTNITYTMLEDTLKFDESDRNALFLKRLMKECNLELPYFSKNTVTRKSGNFKRTSSLVLMSDSCLMKYSHRKYVRWAPYFENGVVSLYMTERDLDEKVDIKSKKEKEIIKIEHVDGFLYETKKICILKRIATSATNERLAYQFVTPGFVSLRKSDLPEHIQEKYKDSPPSVEELLRILGNEFVLFDGFLEDSSVLYGCAGVLPASFEELNRGQLLAECIDVLEEETKTLVKRVVQFRWNGIVVHQQEGGKVTSYVRIINRGRSHLLNKLGQHCFTVRAKTSFYNNSLPPLCEDQDKLDEVLRLVKVSDIPAKATVEDLKKFMSEFFTPNPHKELVFLSEFSQNKQKVVEHIKRFARTQNYGIRTFKTSEHIHNMDSFSIFVKHTPMKLCKMLITTPEHQDLRFQLLPPCGAEENYFEWCTQWREKIIPEEYFKPYEKMVDSADSGTAAIPCNGSGDFTKSAVPEETKKRLVGFVQKTFWNVGDEVYQMSKCSNLISRTTSLLLPKGKRDWIRKAREETDLPQEIVDKYCDTPPTTEVLCRILGDDFTLYYGFGQESYVISKTMAILAESFQALNRGGVMTEQIEVLKKKIPMKKLVKFKWNGICIHEEEGLASESHKNIVIAGQAALINKLGQHFHAVRAKISFYNNGLPPVCRDKEKLNGVQRVVKKTDIPLAAKFEEIKKSINDFFYQSSDMELVFGPAFQHPGLLEPIRRYAIEKELGYRWFKSKKNLRSFDCLGIFIKHTPLEIREKLKKLPDHHDLRFFLIPPCEFGNKSHYEWIKCWAENRFGDEVKLIKKNETLPHLDQKSRLKLGLDKRNVTHLQTPRQQMVYRPQPSRQEVQKLPVRQPKNFRGENSRSHPYKSETLKRDIQQKANRRERNFPPQHQRREVPNQQVRRQPKNYREENSRSQSYRSESRNQAMYQEPRNSYGGNANSDYWREKSQLDYYKDTSYSDYYGDKSRLSYGAERVEETPVYSSAGRKRDWQQMDYYAENSYSQDYRSDNYESSNWGGTSAQYPEPEQYMPEQKRARDQPDRLQWNDIGPLVVLWPLTVRSEHEKDARKVLEANFPTEISLESKNKVAVYVTLPLHNGRDKQFCLCVGDGVHNATKNALDMIVKRSSVIKYTVNFLPPDGQTPNFIRYNIPCQTNPRTYITLTWMETGNLTREKIDEIFESFKESLNEDLFFDKDSYTHEMKLMILELAPKHGLKVRHFGDGYKLGERYVCVYKTKPKDRVLEEVVKMSDFHPKYTLTSNQSSHLGRVF